LGEGVGKGGEGNGGKGRGKEGKGKWRGGQTPPTEILATALFKVVGVKVKVRAR